MPDILKQASVENDVGAALSTTAAFPDSSAASHWDFINSWKVAPQSNDRAPAFGAVVPDSASPSVRRSAVRRKHQAMFKAWSQDRHD